MSARARNNKRIGGALSLVPTVSGRAYVAIDAESGKTLCGARHTARHCIASLTKMTTALTVLRLARDEFSGLLDEWTTVSKEAATTIGTSARLRVGDRVRVGDLLYGLLLPSGNDAGRALAEYIGGKLIERTEMGDFLVSPPRRGSGVGSRENRRRVRAFVGEMDRTAEIFGARATKFINPHGLDVRLSEHLGGPLAHHSTALDVALVARSGLQSFPDFAEIVGTASKTCAIQRDGEMIDVTWENTHKLVQEKHAKSARDTGIVVTGGKTGVTPHAGPCLCTSLVRPATSDSPRRHVIVVVLHAKRKEDRFADTLRLAKWAFHRLDHGNSRSVVRPLVSSTSVNIAPKPKPAKISISKPHTSPRSFKNLVPKTHSPRTPSKSEILVKGLF